MFLAHVKIKSKLSYLGKKITSLHRKMTEKLSFEVDVKNVTEEQDTGVRTELLFYLFRMSCPNQFLLILYDKDLYLIYFF